MTIIFQVNIKMTGRVTKQLIQSIFGCLTKPDRGCPVAVCFKIPRGLLDLSCEAEGKLQTQPRKSKVKTSNKCSESPRYESNILAWC